jgi:hypothetical protein
MLPGRGIVPKKLAVVAAEGTAIGHVEVTTEA